MRFANRKEAGEKLATALEKYKGSEGVVYGLPRGGVPVAREVSKRLGLPLDLVIARKVPHPTMPEYAVCATTENGVVVCNEDEKAALDEKELQKAISEAQKEAARRREVYLKGRDHLSATDKIAIVIDDGAATGLTIRAALMAIKAEKPKKLVVALPVAPSDVVEELRMIADEVVILEDARFYLGAVGFYYSDFPQLTDEEVVGCL